MKTTIILFSLFFANIALGANPIKIASGGPASIKNFDSIRPEMEKLAGLPIELAVYKIGVSLKNLKNGFLDAVLVLEDPTRLEKSKEKYDFPEFNLKEYEWTVFGEGSMVLMLNPANKVSELSKDQITGILNGGIKNWKEVGGKDESIKLFYPSQMVLANRAIAQHYLNTDDPTFGEFAVDMPGLLRALKNSPNAVGVGTGKIDLPDFKPKFVVTDAKFRSYFMTKKSARPEVLKILTALKDRKPLPMN